MTEIIKPKDQQNWQIFTWIDQEKSSMSQITRIKKEIGTLITSLQKWKRYYRNAILFYVY